MKRKIALFVATTMMLSTLASCGGKGGSADIGEEANYNYTGVAPITDKEGQTVSILAQNSWYTTVDIKEAPIVKKVYQDAGINVDWNLVDPTNYADAVGPMLAAGSDLPDIVLLPDQDENMTYIESGIFQPLDEYFDYMPNYKKWLDENPSMKASLTAPDGHIYYVPATNVEYNYQPALMFNMKWVKDAGYVKTPTELSEFVDMLRYFRDHDMNGNGDTKDEIPMSVRKDYLTYMFGPAFGLHFNGGGTNSFFKKEDGTIEYAYYSENYKKYLEFLNQLYTEGLLEVEYTTLTRDQIVERFANDKTGVTYDFGWQMSMTYSPQLPYYDGTIDTAVAGVAPLSGESEGFYYARNPMGNIFGVNKDADNLLLAIKFLDYSVSEANQDLYVWGIEGESYKVDANGNREFLNDGKASDWTQHYGLNPAVVYPARQSVEATDVLVADWHVDVDKSLEQYMVDPWPFIYTTDDESNVMSQYMTDIQTYVDEMMISFISGITPISQFDNYLKTLESMNIQEVLDVKTTQYDRYEQSLK